MSNLARKTTSVATKPKMLVLNYRNPLVEKRLVDEYGLSPEEAAELFQDTLKFLALVGNGVRIAPPAKIDLGWHNFILHTRDYAEFCEKCFGYFVHHEPGVGLTYQGPKMDVNETTTLAENVYGPLSKNWDNVRGTTCGSNGC
jgi:hypothetical protein